MGMKPTKQHTMKRPFKVWGMLLLAMVFLGACHKRQVQNTITAEQEEVIVAPVLPEADLGTVQQGLVTEYLRGEIAQCQYRGAIVYKCSRNAPDAGTEIFDAYGTRIGRCYASTNQIDAICNEATDCKVIYRVAKNIWGKPEVPWVRPQ
jgi:hypothetical protein